MGIYYEHIHVYDYMCGSRGKGVGGPDPPGKFKFLNSHSKITEYSPGLPPPPKTQISLGPPSPMKVFWIRACTKSIYNITSVKKYFLNTSNDRCDCENYKRNVIQIHVRQQRNLCWNITYIHVGKLLLFYNS